MKKLLKGKGKYILSFFCVAMFLSLPLLGLCQGGGVISGMETGLTETGLEELGGSRSLPQAIGSVISVLLGLLGVVFVIIVIYAGVMWMLAQGDETKIAKARKTIINGVIAIIIIFMAYAITTFVISQIGRAAATGGAGA